DGTFIYRPISEVCRNLKVPLVWMQRGCWKPDVDAKNTQRHNADKFCDAVVVPGDYGCDELVDAGGKVVPKYVGPIVISNSDSLHSAYRARELLHLPREKKLVLIQIGAGVINETEGLQAAAINAVNALGEEWAPVLVSNPLNSQIRSNKAYCVEAYPLADYYAAFSFGIFAAGYNTVQESITFKLPGIFIPNLSTKTDDQMRRAKGVVDEGLGLVAIDTKSLEARILELANTKLRNGIKSRMAEALQEDGAKDAAKYVEDFRIPAN
ncbi:MAG: hypothetical protein HLX50_18765, partial [Alteromonadaceae bacterium]|nr:hypothetical protein [Alteromonadaceae bacterium]